MKTKLSIRNRKYPFEHVMSEQTKGMLRNRMMFVTLGQDDFCDTSKLHLDKVCGIVHSLFEENGDIYAKWLIAATPMGKVLEELIVCGGKWELRPVGIGTEKTINNEKQITEDYRLLYLTADADSSQK
jgi:hypothetical protein